jgi:hypothetical protein
MNRTGTEILWIPPPNLSVPDGLDAGREPAGRNVLIQSTNCCWADRESWTHRNSRTSASR